MPFDTIILAGGKGSRMDQDLPKALTLAKGKPIISHQIDFLKDKTEKIIVSLGHHAEKVIDFIKKEYNPNQILFSVEDEPLGTAGGIKKALKLATTEFVLVLNCDDLTNIDVEKLSNTKESTICVAHPILPYGLVEEKDGYATFKEKPKLDSWVSNGWYFLNKEEFLRDLPDKGSIEYDVFPKKKLRLFKHEDFWFTINTKKDVLEFEKIK